MAGNSVIVGYQSQLGATIVSDCMSTCGGHTNLSSRVCVGDFKLNRPPLSRLSGL